MIQAEDPTIGFGEKAALLFLWVFVLVHAGVLEYAQLHPLAASQVWKNALRLHLGGGGPALLFLVSLSLLFRARRRRGAADARRLTVVLFGLFLFALLAHGLEFAPLFPWRAKEYAQEIHTIVLSHLSSAWYGVPLQSLSLLASSALVLALLTVLSCQGGGAARRVVAIGLSVLSFALYFDVVVGATTGAPLFGSRVEPRGVSGAGSCPPL